MSLKARLKAMIRADGPISVSTYMTLCLHDRQQGYYATRPGLGRDFITAPEISQVFGELLGLWAGHEWQALGGPDVLQLVELGPGRATLMADALRASARVSGFSAARRPVLVEASPILRDVQAERLEAAVPDFAGSLDQVLEGPMILIANEYLDCLPARQFVKAGSDWHERVIGLDDDGELVFGLAADTAPDMPALGEMAGCEVQPGLELLIAQLQARQAAGHAFRALFLDYGPVNAAPDDSLRAFQAGQQVHPLAAPGESDLTVDVDFGRLARLAKAAGLSVHGPVAQGGFLLSLGAEARLNQLASKAPDQAETLYQGVRKLVDPAEMGARFKVICLSSPDLPVPAGFAP